MVQDDKPVGLDGVQVCFDDERVVHAGEVGCGPPPASGWDCRRRRGVGSGTVVVDGLAVQGGCKATAQLLFVMCLCG